MGICSMGFSQQNIQWKSYDFQSKSGETVQAEKGTISVPENRKDSDSREIELHFVKFKSTNPNPSSPIIYLAGGPGGSGISTAQEERFELFMALRKVADVIALDQRGTGLSNQIPNCETRASIPIDQPGTQEMYISKLSQAAKACIDSWKEQGVQIEGYNTQENADDIEELRKSLGANKISLWGISYGSHLAFNYIKRYDENLDKVILAGLEGPDQTIKLPENNQQFLENLNAEIQKDKDAASAYPDLIGLMKDVHASLAKEPVIAKIDPRRSGKTIDVGISKLDVQLVTTYFLTKNPEDSKSLPYLYYQMSQGNYDRIATMVYGLKSYAGVIQGMPLMMDAMSGVSEKRWKEVQEQENKCVLGRTTNFPYPDLAMELDLPDLGKEFRSNPKSDVKALFFSGTLDGRTYLESSKELTKGFKNAINIIIDGAGHDLFMSTNKVEELMIDFLLGEKVASQEIKIDPPRFILP